MQDSGDKEMQHRPRRIAMYVIYDKDGKLDRFRKYYLQELRKEVDTIVGVVSGTLTPESRDELAKLTDDFFVRENKGLLAGSWIDGIAHIGWDTLAEYDELLMLNDSFFGPFYPLSEMFDAMEKSDADFYGAMKVYGVESWSEIEGRPLKHHKFNGSICYFYVIRSRLLHSAEFKKYWSSSPVIKEDLDTFFFSEFEFYDYVCDAGFRVEAYQSDDYKDYYYDMLTHGMHALISKDRIPFARIRPLGTDMKEQSSQLNCGQDPRHTLDYIAHHTDYDTTMIWDYLLRTKNLTDIFNQLQLEYVVPRNSVEKPFTYEKKVAVILHIYYADEVERIATYCENFPPNTDFYVTTTSEKTKEVIHKAFDDRNLHYEVQIRPNVGVAMSTLWITYANVTLDGKYEYICYFHDKKSPYAEFGIVGSQFGEKCYENLFGTREVVENIINLLEANPRMGVIGAPMVYHGLYFCSSDKCWPGNYQNTVELIKKLDLKVSVNPAKAPVAPYGDMFWFRADALKKAISHGFTYDDFDIHYKPDCTILHAIERIYGFAAQDSGYYYAEVINTDQAQSDLVEYRYMLQTLCKDLYDKEYYYSSFNQLQQITKNDIPRNGVPRGFARRFLYGLINRPSTHKLGLFLQAAYRRLFNRK